MSPPGDHMEIGSLKNFSGRGRCSFGRRSRESGQESPVWQTSSVRSGRAESEKNRAPGEGFVRADAAGGNVISPGNGKRKVRLGLWRLKNEDRRQWDSVQGVCPIERA